MKSNPRPPLALLLPFAAVACVPAGSGGRDVPTAFAAGPGLAEEPAPQGRRTRVLVLDQVAEGLPDREPGRPLHQKMFIDEPGRRVILHLYGENAPGAPGGPAGEPVREIDRRIILRMDLDPPEIYEIWDRERAYRKTVRDLNRIQEERDRLEEEWLRHLPNLTAAERKEFLAENFLQRNGKRDVDVVRGGKARLLDHECEEVKVFENGREVLRAWVTQEVSGARSFFHLYRRLGAFSREVLERVAEIGGLPLEAEITVVTAAPAYRIGAKCIRIDTREIPESEFEPPPGYQERKTDLSPVVKCPWDQKDVERGEEGFRFSDSEGVLHLFCSKECFKSWDRARRNPGPQPGPAPPPPAGKKK